MKKTTLESLLEAQGLERYDMETLNLAFRQALRNFAPPVVNGVSTGETYFYVVGREKILERALQESAGRLLMAGYIARLPGYVMDHPMVLTKKGTSGFAKLLEAVDDNGDKK